MRSKVVFGTLCGLATVFAAGVGTAHAADLAPVAPAPAPVGFWDTVKFSGQIDAGVTFNELDPGTKRNFGHLFTDHANIPLLNQVLLTVQRPLDPKATGYDFGFKIQGLYGSDARYTHFLGELDDVIKDRNQVDIVEAWGIVHLPVLTSGGIDVKVGQYVTLEGAEVIDPSGDVFYSHSYIFNFGIPFKHTGVMTITHVNPILDIYAGVDTGVNTTFVRNVGDNNNAGAFHGGFGLNLLDGNLTALATTHIGPENPQTAFTGPIPNGIGALRYLNDLTIVYKATDKLTFTGDLNYARDDGFNADGYGAAGYASYKFNDMFTLNGRAEVWRDANGFFVAQFPGNLDFRNVELGRPNSGLITGGSPVPGASVTYSEFTFGIAITPPVPKPLASLTIRPEVRYDRALNSATPFGGASPGAFGTSKDQLTFGGDIVIAF